MCTQELCTVFTCKTQITHTHIHTKTHCAFVTAVACCALTTSHSSYLWCIVGFQTVRRTYPGVVGEFEGETDVRARHCEVKGAGAYWCSKNRKIVVSVVRAAAVGLAHSS